MTRKVVLSFPPSHIEEPVTYHLIKEYGLKVNILRATVRPREAGRMVVALDGDKEAMNHALDYLDESGVQVDPLVQEMHHLTDRCIHCTACTAVCPTGALSVDPVTREVSLDAGACIICEACIPTCSYNAIKSGF